MVAQSELVEYQLASMQVVQLLSTLPIVSTAECVEELLDIRLEVQMPLVWKLLHNHLTPTMSMESVSLMDYLVITSEPLLLVYQKDFIDTKMSIVHAANLMMLVIHSPHHLLETTTIANRAIQPVASLFITSTVVIHSGMASSVKVSVVAMENLHGSVWSYRTKQLMILRCAFAKVGSLVMILLYICWNCTSNEIWKIVISQTLTLIIMYAY